MSEDEIEPGILQVFRLCVGVEWLLAGGAALLRWRQHADIADAALWTWAQSSFLLLWLTLPWLPRAVGRVFLPVALVVASASPIVGHALSARAMLASGTPAALAIAEPGRLSMLLLVPLLLVSVQYGYRAMLAFTWGTALLMLALMLALVPLGRGLALALVLGAGLRPLVFMLVGFIVVRLAKAQRQLRRDLVQKNAQLANYASTLEELAVSRERNRLARELHDTLAHTLSALSIQLKALEVQLGSAPEQARATLAQAQGITSSGLDEARRTLHALRARPLESMGLLAALRQLAERGAERGGWAAQVEMPPALPALLAEVEQQLYRVAEEALQNVERHAQARHVRLALQHSSGIIQLEVADDGVGFDSAAPAPAGHYGLGGLRERAQLIGATLEIASAPGRGTRLRLSVPYAEGRA